ncbi:hypothetical protein BCV69DRAFT_79693 [Microstroma glucosiphilum]|uniref:GPI mannosyltransferase 2 n=1 Tax=Pseudomicrostroma glucosiphilum TaxID=1684307 RepID=A0A316U196_9BASI|nr:hypothetical protein BCV69DRAFT_79693 [Pseudomicrostroma glucosiphilum]PWN18243.1 hypothetical protein BCV69DRAFT_79693 [Pseudomicrostroma glucosiphilum]
MGKWVACLLLKLSLVVSFASFESSSSSSILNPYLPTRPFIHSSAHHPLSSSGVLATTRYFAFAAAAAAYLHIYSSFQPVLYASATIFALIADKQMCGQDDGDARSVRGTFGQSVSRLITL